MSRERCLLKERARTPYLICYLLGRRSRSIPTLRRLPATPIAAFGSSAGRPMGLSGFERSRLTSFVSGPMLFPYYCVIHSTVFSSAAGIFSALLLPLRARDRLHRRCSCMIYAPVPAWTRSMFPLKRVTLFALKDSIYDTCFFFPTATYGFARMVNSKKLRTMPYLARFRRMAIRCCIRTREDPCSYTCFAMNLRHLTCRRVPQHAYNLPMPRRRATCNGMPIPIIYLPASETKSY